MRRSKKFITALVLAMIMLIGVAVSSVYQTEQIVFAEEFGTAEIDASGARMQYISSYMVVLSIDDDGVASVSGFVNAKVSNADMFANITLQKMIGDSWGNVRSWSVSAIDESITIGEMYPVSAGTYRAVATYRVNTETKYDTSAVRTYPD